MFRMIGAAHDARDVTAVDPTQRYDNSTSLNDSKWSNLADAGLVCVSCIESCRLIITKETDHEIPSLPARALALPDPDRRGHGRWPGEAVQVRHRERRGDRRNNS